MTKVQELREIGMDNGGFVESADAAAVGLDPKALSRMAGGGRLHRELHGIYRFPEIPIDDSTEYRLALLWAGAGAALDAESVLVALNLCDVNPRFVHVVVPPGRRIRRQGKDHYRLSSARFDVEMHRDLAMVALPQAIERALDQGLRHDLAVQAVANALRLGLLQNAEAHEILKSHGAEEVENEV